MRILAHIFTFNDADVIDQTIEAIRRQTRPVAGIVLVDNASSDGTLERPSVKHATVVRNRENVGASGAVLAGLRFALEQDYDWVWVFDADNSPEPDALEKLLALYASWPQGLQDEIGFLACSPRNVCDGSLHHGVLFTARGLVPAKPAPEQRHYVCHATIWSGCLYRLAAVRRTGLPNPDYVLDFGEMEYPYRLMKAGYKAFMSRDAIVRHNIRGSGSMTFEERRLGPLRFRSVEYPPIRCYYTCRNTFYFVLYDAKEWYLGLLSQVSWTTLRLTVNFLLRPQTHGRHLRACVRGIWHGLTGNISARY